jgi:hypothetical protein
VISSFFTSNKLTVMAKTVNQLNTENNTPTNAEETEVGLSGDH